jgi:hypothetical protein
MVGRSLNAGVAIVRSGDIQPVWVGARHVRCAETHTRGNPLYWATFDCSAGRREWRRLNEKIKSALAKNHTDEPRASSGLDFTQAQLQFTQ